MLNRPLDINYKSARYLKCTAFHLEHCKMPGHMIPAYRLCFEDVFATCQQCCTYALLSSRISGLCGDVHYVVICPPCGTMWLLCGSPLCGPPLPPPPPVNLHLNVSQAFVLDRPPPPSVYWSRFFDNFPGLSNIWGSAHPKSWWRWCCGLSSPASLFCEFGNKQWVLWLLSDCICAASPTPL